ncbi:MAG: hypothetical protein ACJ75J_05060 [Cytophagaceae bacterium]
MKKLVFVIFSVVLLMGTAQAASTFQPKKHHHHKTYKSHSNFHILHKKLVDRTYQN